MHSRALVNERKGKERLLEEQLDIMCMKFEEIILRKSMMLLITSPGKEDSRTIVTCKLAESLANKGKNVLLVDANFHSPFMHKWFRANSPYGFAELLVTGASSEFYTKTTIEGLTVVSAGMESGLAGRRLNKDYEKEFESWREIYDIVLIQAPPAQVSTPLSIITKACDGIIFIVKEKKDKKKDIKKLAEHFQKIGKPVTGVIYQKI